MLNFTGGQRSLVVELCPDSTLWIIPKLLMAFKQSIYTYIYISSSGSANDMGNDLAKSEESDGHVPNIGMQTGKLTVQDTKKCKINHNNHSTRLSSANQL